MQSIQEELQITRVRLDTEKQSVMSIEKDLQHKLKEGQEIQCQLTVAITEKGAELDEVRKNAEENNKTLRGMIQQLKDKLEGTEQSLQHQLKVNAQLQLPIETIFKSTWSLQLNNLAIGGNGVVPIVIKLSEFEKHKRNTYIQFTTTGF